jgi:hypothetical protein
MEKFYYVVGWFYGVLKHFQPLLVEETGGPGENHRHVASHSQTLSHNVVHK